jgi:hypothetical protein
MNISPLKIPKKFMSHSCVLKVELR